MAGTAFNMRHVVEMIDYAKTKLNVLLAPVIVPGMAATALLIQTVRAGPGTLHVLLIACTLNQPPVKFDAALSSILLVLLGLTAVIPLGRVH